MIAKMKKVSLVVLSSRRTRSVEQLRQLGVMHVETSNVESESLSQLLQKRGKIERALAAIPPSEEESSVSTKTVVEDAISIADHVEGLVNERRDLHDALEKLDREHSRILPWGDFPPDLIGELAEHGVHVRLYTAGKKEFERISDKDRVFVVSERKTDVVRFARVALGDSEAVVGEGSELQPFTRSLSEVADDIASKQRQLEQIQHRLAEVDRSVLESAMAVLNREIEFESVDASMGDDGDICFVTGFVPAADIEAVRSAARTDGWALLVQDPAPEDPVPTEIRNPKAIRIIQPVFDLLGTVPGYRELDISFWFLSFFSIFFAMIIGDGGYGLILLIMSTVLLVRAKRNTGRIGDGLILLTLLSTFTVVWGAITGNWFGYEGFSRLPVLSSLIIPGLDSFVPRSAFYIQWMCFILGAVHLTIAHTWNFIRGLRERPRIRAFADLGWLAVVFGVYFLVLNVVLDAEQFPIPQFAIYSVAAGVGLVLITNQQEEGSNFFVGIGRGLANIIPTALSSINVFSDTVSYIRLYAVGLASIEIAKSFNAMAGSIGSGVGGIIAAALILALGHTLNLAMGALSVVVHGVRLNVLEFSGHLGMEWTGIPYRPFGKTA